MREKRKALRKRRGWEREGEPDRRWKKRSRSYCYTDIYHEAIMTSFVSASKNRERREGKEEREREQSSGRKDGGAQS